MDLFTKAKELGIDTEFIDAHGERRVTDEGALKIIIDALSLGAPHPLLNGAVVVRSGRATRTRLKQAATFPVRWKIVSGEGIVAEGEARAGQGGSGDRLIHWPPGLPEGSYRLQLRDAASVTDEAPLIVAPEKAFSGDFDRSWLLAVQLYGVRSARNWGIGDFSDLERLIELAAQL
ncbi:MAG TPA: 4-alpha-glucanotransferase, partial [Bradyrhizobium sp.]|nr:4-alpha-glucanotransferase [Bradyrhizobium sp.]